MSPLLLKELIIIFLFVIIKDISSVLVSIIFKSVILLCVFVFVCVFYSNGVPLN